MAFPFILKDEHQTGLAPLYVGNFCFELELANWMEQVEYPCIFDR